MSHGICGIFAVDSHLAEEAFIREVLLYDRLLIPRPPANEPAEWDRWVQRGWDPARQERLLAILGSEEHPASSGATLALPVDWNEAWRGAWRQHWAHSQPGDSPFVATAQILKVAVPAAYEALEAVVPYRSLEEFADKVSLQPRPQGQDRLPGTTLLALIGYELLLPVSSANDDALLDAVELACDPDFRRKRAALNDWARRFVRPLQLESDGSLAGYTDPASLREALSELRDQVAECERLAKRRRWTRPEHVFTAVTFIASGLSMVASPVGLVGVFASIGQYVARNMAVTHGQEGNGSLAGAAMLVTARRELGWHAASRVGK